MLQRAEDHIGLVGRFVQRWNKHHIPPDEMVQFSEASIGLMTACRTFDPTRGVKFSTYAFACMKNECRKQWKVRQTWNNRHITDKFEMLRQVEMPVKSFNMDKEWLREKISLLPPQMRNIMDRQMLGQEKRFVSKALGISTATLYRLEQIIKNYLIRQGAIK